MSKKHKIKAVIFDLGETLHTRKITIEEQENDIAAEVTNMLKNEGYDISKEYYKKIKDENWQKWKNNTRTNGTEFKLENFLIYLLYKLNIQQLDIVTEIEKIIYKNDLKNIILKPTVIETLKYLHDKKFILGIISNSSYSYEHTIKMLNKLKIKNYFIEVFVSSKEGVSKPNRLIFEKALFALGVTPGESIFVGDNAEIDIPGAKEIGMKTFLLTDNQNIINVLPFV